MPDYKIICTNSNGALTYILEGFPNEEEALGCVGETLNGLKSRFFDKEIKEINAKVKVTVKVKK